jgi:hypothetical protein
MASTSSGSAVAGGAGVEVAQAAKTNTPNINTLANEMICFIDILLVSPKFVTGEILSYLC